MIATVILATALAAETPPAPIFATPLSDADLAATVSGARPLTVRTLLEPAYGIDARLTRDLVDNWWADEGAMLIAESVRPTPTLAAGFDLGWLRGGTGGLRISYSVSALTRP